MERPAPHERVGIRPIVEAVRVGFCNGAVPGMEGGNCLARAYTSEVRRQYVVEPRGDGCRIQRGLCPEIGSLSVGVHTGIGAARAYHVDALAEQAGQRILQGLLHRARASAKPLPTRKIGAVIREHQEQVPLAWRGQALSLNMPWFLLRYIRALSPLLSVFFVCHAQALSPLAGISRTRADRRVRYPGSISPQ